MNDVHISNLLTEIAKVDSMIPQTLPAGKAETNPLSIFSKKQKSFKFVREPEII